jgi:protein gp37
MVRCDEFYQKVQREGTDWCRKAPRTASRIQTFISDIMPALEDEIAKSEILTPEKIPIGNMVSEAASRPLIQEKNPVVREKVIEKVVKLAEEKVIDGVKPQVTAQEVTKIVQEIKHTELVDKTQVEVFDKAGPEIEFAGWSWDPHKLDAPNNTEAPQDGSEIKRRLVYLNADIFEEGFSEDEMEKIVQVIRESPQWIFMVPTLELERLSEIDWPSNAWIGYVIDSQDSVKPVVEAFIEMNDTVKFVICDLHKESIAFDKLKGFNWIIIRNLSRFQPKWQRVESVLEQSLADSLWIYLMPNIKVRPMEYPRLREQNVGSQMQEGVSQELVKAAA